MSKKRIEIDSLSEEELVELNHRIIESSNR